MQILTPLTMCGYYSQTLWTFLNGVESTLLERKGDNHKYQTGCADHCSTDAQSPKEANQEPGQALMASEVKRARRRKITTR